MVVTFVLHNHYYYIVLQSNQSIYENIFLSSFLFSASLISLFLRLQMRGFNKGITTMQNTDNTLFWSVEQLDLGITQMNVTVPQNTITAVRCEVQVEKAFWRPSVERIFRMVMRMQVQEMAMTNTVIIMMEPAENESRIMRTLL